jgi:PKD repeat protein
MMAIPRTSTIGTAFLLIVVLFTVPAMAEATTSVNIIKYASDGTTILNQTTIDFQWMEKNLPVYGDGVTHYYHQGPVFNASIPDPWNPMENDPAILTKDYGAVKGTDVADLCNLVGGMSADDINVTLKAPDGFSKAFAYSSVYSPASRTGPVIVTWYRSDQGYVNQSYATGMRNVIFADTSTNPWGNHVFGLWDMHQSYPEAFWYYYQPGKPSTTGLSVQNIDQILIYSSVPPPVVPVANFTALPLSGTIPLTVQFTDTSSNNPTGWAWDFNDDGIIDSTIPNPQFTYEIPGTYSVNVTVSNAAGSDSEVKEGCINGFAESNTTPKLALIPASAAVLTGEAREYQLIVDILPKGLAGYDLVCTISNTSVGEILQVSYPSWAGLTNTTKFSDWTFRLSGVDVNRQIQPGAVNVILATVTVRGERVGETQITISDIHMDADGGDAITPLVNNGLLTVYSLTPVPPEANFTATPRSGDAPLTVRFTDTSGGSPLTWAWDFNNDGMIDNTTRNPGYTYPSPGTYSVNLTVTNNAGSDSELKTDYILVIAPPVAPVANFTGDPTTGTAPLNVQFSDHSTGTITSYAWDFTNDGIVDSTLQNPGYTYPSAGTYTVKLNVTGPGGSNARVRTNYITVIAPPVAPVANFTGNPTTGTAPLDVQFTDHSTGTITSYAWDFTNDGIIDSTLQNPGYTYPSKGTYSVRLNVSGPGGSDSRVRTDYISVIAPPSGTAAIAGWVASGSDYGPVYVPGIRVRFATSASDLSHPVKCWEATTDAGGSYSLSGLPSGVVLYAMALSPDKYPDLYYKWPIQYQINTGRLITCPDNASVPQISSLKPGGSTEVNWILKQNPYKCLFLL